MNVSRSHFATFDPRTISIDRDEKGVVTNDRWLYGPIESGTVAMLTRPIPGSRIPERPENQHALEREPSPADDVGGVAAARHPLDDDSVGRHVDVCRKDRDE